MNKNFCLIVFLVFLVSSCGGGGGESSGSSDVDEQVNGVFYIKGPTIGDVSIVREDGSMVKWVGGSFQCNRGEELVFSFGQFYLGKALCSEIITPYDLVGATLTVDLNGESEVSLSPHQKLILTNIALIFENFSTYKKVNGVYVSDIRLDALSHMVDNNSVSELEPIVFYSHIQSYFGSSITLISPEESITKIQSQIVNNDFGIFIESDIQVHSGESFLLSATFSDLSITDLWWQPAGYTYLDGDCSTGSADSTCVLPLNFSYIENDSNLIAPVVGYPVRFKYILVVAIDNGIMLSRVVYVTVLPLT